MSATHYLPPNKIKICCHDGLLFLKMDGQKVRLAQPKRAIPLSGPDEFILLSNENGEEIGVIRLMRDLEASSRELLQEALEEAYRVTRISKVLDVEREPLSGRVRWRVEIVGESEGEEPTEESAKSPGFRLLRRPKIELDDDGLENALREVTFFISGAEDVQTARYPHIFFSDVDGNKYEILDCETLDLASRRAAERYF